MNTEEALYWKNYIDRTVAEKLSVLNSSQQDAVLIRQFADSYMSGITGQQLLPQAVFRKFLEMFSNIPAMQGNIEQMQETLNETVENLREAGEQIADKAENINNIEKVYYDSAEYSNNMFYHTYDTEWVESHFGDEFDNINENDVINALYDEISSFPGCVHIVLLDFKHRGVKSCSYIMFKVHMDGPILTGVPRVKYMLLSIDGYYTWNVSVRVHGKNRVRTIRNIWHSYATQTDTDQQRDVIVVDSYESLLEIENEDRDTNVIYRTTDNDKLFLWNETEFVEVGGESVDNTIYVTDLNQLFNLNLTSGVYAVAHNYKSGLKYYTDIYSLVVNNYVLSARNVAKLVLSNSNGWADVVSDENDNLSWDWHLYAYKDDVETKIVKQIRKINVNTQRSTEKKEVVEVASYEALLQLSEPEGEVIYITLDEHKLYIYTDNGFVDAANGDSDNTIYVSNLNELIALELPSGAYQVCHTYLLDSKYNTDYYTLAITEFENDGVVARNLTLADINGWAEVLNNTWAWHKYIYRDECDFAPNNHKHLLKDISDIELTEDSDAEMVIPIESETLIDIVNGNYEASDTEMFSGNSQYTPLTSAQIDALVDRTIAAMQPTEEEN